MEHRVRQLAASNGQLAEIRRQKSGVKLISDLRLLTSVIDDPNGFNNLSFTVHRLRFDNLTNRRIHEFLHP